MKRSLRLTLVLALASAVAVSTAFAATDSTYHGAQCNPLNHDTDFARLRYNEFGIFQWGASGVTSFAACNATMPSTTSDVTRVHLTGYDRHNVSNTSCFVRGQSLNGTTLWSTSLTMVGFSSGSQTITSNLLPVNSTAAVSMICTIPPFHSSNGASVVTSYRVQTATP